MAAIDVGSGRNGAAARATLVADVATHNATVSATAQLNLLALLRSRDLCRSSGKCDIARYAAMAHNLPDDTVGLARNLSLICGDCQDTVLAPPH